MKNQIIDCFVSDIPLALSGLTLSVLVDLNCYYNLYCISPLYYFNLLEFYLSIYLLY